MLEINQDKVLISVPSTNLVKQMHSDFCEYETGPIVCNQCYEMESGKPKTTKNRVVIATWAMLLRQPPEWFQSFDSFICDESHQASSPALSKIISNLTHVPFRFGFTGTLDGSKTHELQCRAWFGSLIRSSSTKELMDRKILSELKVRNLVLKYPESERKLVSKLDYKNEIAYTISHLKRNEIIIDLAMKQEKNTLVLFNLISKHGDKLLEMAKEKSEEYGKKIYMIVGDIDADEREKIRKDMEKRDDVVLFASFGTLSVGVNIKNLHNIIFCHPYKARIRTLQSIGRSLRTIDGKNFATLIDICDDFRYKKHINTLYKHFLQRLALYESEKFNTTFETIEI